MGVYLEGQGDLVSRLILGTSRVTLWVIGVIHPSRVAHGSFNPFGGLALRILLCCGKQGPKLRDGFGVSQNQGPFLKGIQGLYRGTSSLGFRGIPFCGKLPCMLEDPVI